MVEDIRRQVRELVEQLKQVDKRLQQAASVAVPALVLGKLAVALDTAAKGVTKQGSALSRVVTNADKAQQ